MLISVIIPVYNVEKTLERAVTSVTNQSVRQLEIILVNDGSTDRSGIICDELSELDSRIKVIHKENGGLSSARNSGIENAKGDFLAFLDSDDYFSLDILKSFVEVYNKNPDIDIYCFNVMRVSGEKQIAQKSVNSSNRNEGENIAALFDNSGIDFYAWNKIYSKELFGNVRYPIGKLYEDIVTTYELTKRAKNVISTEEIGIYYISNPLSIVASEFNPKQYDNVSERIVLLDKIKDEFPQNYSRALEKVLDGFLSTGFKIASSKKNEVTNSYYVQLKNDIFLYKNEFKKEKSINKLKLIALWLLLFNRSLYKILYKTYLRK